MKSICIVPIYNEFDQLQVNSQDPKNIQNNDDIDFLLVDNGSIDNHLKL